MISGNGHIYFVDVIDHIPPNRGGVQRDRQRDDLSRLNSGARRRG